MKHRRSLSERLDAAALLRPSKVAITMLTSNSVDITFGSMLQQIRNIAHRLAKENVALGDRVALIGENHPNWAIAYLGILYRGAVVMPLDPSAPVQSIANFLRDSEARLAFVSPSSADRFREACVQLGQTIPAVTLQPSKLDCGWASFAEWSRPSSLSDIAAGSFPIKSEDLALLIYTSGTTGHPKAVPLTHGNINAQIEAVEEVMKITEKEVVLSILPLFHVYSQVVNLWLSATIGARVVYFNEFGSAELEQGLRRSGATALMGVPKLWYLFHAKVFDAVLAKPSPVKWAFRTMLTLNGVLRDSFGINFGPVFFRPIHRAFGGGLRLAVSAGARFDPKIANDFHRLGLIILQGYGLTETSGAVAATRFEDNVVGSVGRALPGVELKIDKPDQDGIGEILIRGPVVTAGYYRNPQATGEAFTAEGWFRSGDLGRLDERGHLYIVGRTKDAIILPNGKNVYPEDLEPHYERSPAISEICVLGIQDNTSSFVGVEKLFAVVVPNFEYLRTEDIVDVEGCIRIELEKLGGELPKYQRLRDFIVRSDPLPRTTTRKIQRFALQSELVGAELPDNRQSPSGSGNDLFRLQLEGRSKSG